jgi:cytochrome c6
MKKILVMCIALAISVFAYNVIIAADKPASSEMKMKQQAEKASPDGEALFMQHCSVCHPEGGNIITPDKTLHKEDMNEFGIRTPEDIIKMMRNPGKAMRKFDAHTITDKDAKKIAEYILKTF